MSKPTCWASNWTKNLCEERGAKEADAPCDTAVWESGVHQKAQVTASRRARSEQTRSAQLHMKRHSPTPLITSP